MKGMYPVKYVFSGKLSFWCPLIFMEVIRLPQGCGKSGHPLFLGILETDIQHCFKSDDIPKNEGGQISPHLCCSLMISIKFD